MHTARHAVATFFNFAYDNMAEDLAETEAAYSHHDLVGLDDSHSRGARESDMNDDSVVSQYCTDLANKPTKWLAFHTIPDLYEVMRYWVRVNIDGDNDSPF